MGRRLRTACRHLQQASLRGPRWYTHHFGMASGSSDSLAAPEGSVAAPEGPAGLDDDVEDGQGGLCPSPPDTTASWDSELVAAVATLNGMRRVSRHFPNADSLNSDDRLLASFGNLVLSVEGMTVAAMHAATEPKNKRTTRKAEFCEQH
eukprot:11065710-Alexandrium_andersonii.AAC.1